MPEAAPAQLTTALVEGSMLADHPATLTHEEPMAQLSAPVLKEAVITPKQRADKDLHGLFLLFRSYTGQDLRPAQSVRLSLVQAITSAELAGALPDHAYGTLPERNPALFQRVESLVLEGLAKGKTPPVILDDIRNALRPHGITL